MSRSSFKEILDRYLSGQATEEEKSLLFRFYEEYGSETTAALTKEEEEALLTDFRQRAGVRSTGIIKKLLFSVYSKAAVLLIMAGGILLWVTRKHEAPLTAIRTGRGEVKKIILPDNSSVTLNAKSSIRFNEEDFKAHRDITLEGEALFQVVHDRQYPFTVHTGSGLYVRDLGTEFVVDNYATLPEIKISVLSGLVRVGKQNTVYGILKRNQEIRYDLGQGTVKTTTADSAQAVAWNTGQWIYNDMTLSDLETLLSNNYNITIVNKTKVEPHVKADMNFSKDQKPKVILNIFSLAAGCRYKWAGKDSVEIY
jgi:ferric-dicitrate binding protein FerR (iron transport regulator)